MIVRSHIQKVAKTVLLFFLEEMRDASRVGIKSYRHFKRGDDNEKCDKKVFASDGKQSKQKRLYSVPSFIVFSGDQNPSQ